MNHDIIIPDWDAPPKVRSFLTTRHGGCSKAPFDSFNLAEHVDDIPGDVAKNRQRLMTLLPSEPVWLNQIHSNKVVDAGSCAPGIDADGSYTLQTDMVSVVMTADCLPVLICNRQASVVAAVHAGWRGLASGILEQGVAKVLGAAQCQPQELLIWLGPAIGPEKFEVGGEVRQIFIESSADKENMEQCFTSVKKTKYLADIYQLARIKLSALGIENIAGGNYCTYTDDDKFFSYRRDGKTGRMASLIWLEK